MEVWVWGSLCTITQSLFSINLLRNKSIYDYCGTQRWIESSLFINSPWMPSLQSCHYWQPNLHKKGNHCKMQAQHKRERIFIDSQNRDYMVFIDRRAIPPIDRISFPFHDIAYMSISCCLISCLSLFTCQSIIL